MGYHVLESLQAATICRDCLPGTRIDRSPSHYGNCMVLDTPTHPVQQYSHSVNVSATFSPPLATLTHQDSRTWLENSMSILKDGPYHRQLLPTETAMEDILALPDPQQRDLAALRTFEASNLDCYLPCSHSRYYSLHIFSYFRWGSPGKILLK